MRIAGSVIVRLTKIFAKNNVVGITGKLFVNGKLRPSKESDTEVVLVMATIKDIKMGINDGITYNNCGKALIDCTKSAPLNMDKIAINNKITTPKIVFTT